MKSLLICSLIFICSYSTSAQDYFIESGDTTFCDNLTYMTNMKGRVKYMEYNDLNGNVIKVHKGEAYEMDIQTFYIDSLTIDNTPSNVKKQNNDFRLTIREVDGPVKVYVEHKILEMDYNVATGVRAIGDEGRYRFFVQFPDGTYYDVNKRNVLEIIKPYLMKCDDFKDQFDGEVTWDEQKFIKAVKFYNSLCQ